MLQKMEIINLLRDLGIFGLAMWFIQMLLSKSADRKFEAYKAELDNKTRECQATLDSKMEWYKAELSLQNYKSTHIYEKQLDIITDLHKKLVMLNQDIRAINLCDEEQKAESSYNEFLQSYCENLIFIPKKTSDLLKNFRYDNFRDFMLKCGREFGSHYSSESQNEKIERLNISIQLAIEQLILDFRHLIGVENLNNKLKI